MAGKVFWQTPRATYFFFFTESPAQGAKLKREFVVEAPASHHQSTAVAARRILLRGNVVVEALNRARQLIVLSGSHGAMILACLR